jgi:hypothetical protein
MAIELKTPQQIALLREAERIVAETYEVLRPHGVQPKPSACFRSAAARP